MLCFVRFFLFLVLLRLLLFLIIWFVFYPFVRVILVKSVDFVQLHLIRDGPFGWERLCDLPFGRTLSHGHLSVTICSSDLAHLPDLVPFFYF